MNARDDRIDPYFDAKRAAKLEAKYQQATALADATRARGEAIVALCGGLGLAAALIGAAVFVAAKEPPAPAKAGVAAVLKETTAQAPPPMTEREFMSQPEFKTAEYQGRLITVDLDGLKFDTSASAFALAKYDPASGRMVPDRDATLAATRFVGDLAFCRSIPGNDLFKCWALHQGIVIDLDQSESVKP
jgi:hypothetical protein